MTRLLPHTYISRHRHLRRLWLESIGEFARLAYAEQLDLHRYYSPAIDEPDEVHLAHRAWISKQDSSLPQRAGRAYAHLMRAGTPGVVMAPQHGRHRLSVAGLARPEPDIQRLTRLLIDEAIRRGRDDHAT